MVTNRCPRLPAPSDLLKNRQKTTSPLCPLARATHTHTTHDDTTGPEDGDCMLVDGSSGGPSQELRRPPNCRKPALERLARHSLFDRYMKAQLRLAGGRRKPGRHGFSSDTPRGSLALPYICATCATCARMQKNAQSRPRDSSRERAAVLHAGRGRRRSACSGCG